MVSKAVKFISSDVAKKIDADLMGELHFTLYQLAELAGLSAAQAINNCIEKRYAAKPKNKFNILAICGPGSIPSPSPCRQRR